MATFKTFRLRCECLDPRPLKLKVEGRAYVLRGNKLTRAKLLDEEALSEDDLTELERHLAPLKLSYNDIVHGEHEVKVLRFQVPESVEVVEVLSLRDEERGWGRAYVVVWSSEGSELAGELDVADLNEGELAKVLGER